MLNKIEKLRNRKALISGEMDYIRSSILIPLIEDKNELSLLFEVRSENLKRQPNEIFFPGGGVEHGEEPMHTAIRETSEELCIEPKNIDVLGASDILVTPFNNLIYTFIGFLKCYDGNFNEEVKEIFTAPLSFFLFSEPLCYNNNIYIRPEKNFPYNLIQNGKDYNWAKGKNPVYFYIYENRIIWGLTAKIIYDFIKILKMHR